MLKMLMMHLQKWLNVYLKKSKKNKFLIETHNFLRVSTIVTQSNNDENKIVMNQPKTKKKVCLIL